MRRLCTYSWINIFLVIATGVCMLSAGCSGSSSSRPQVLASENSGGPDLSGLAAQGFQMIATQALEQQCDQGQSAACTIAYALNPAYQQGKQLDEIASTLKSMADDLTDIDNKLDTIKDSIDDLSKQLNVDVKDLIFADKQGVAQNYILPIVNAYEDVQSDFALKPDNNVTDFLSKQSPATAHNMANGILWSVSSGPSYNLVDNLHTIQNLIIGDNSDSGLLESFVDKVLAEIAPSSGAAPQDYDQIINGYKLIEQYFGHMLAYQAKALTLVSMSYNYVRIMNVTDINLPEPTFDEYTAKRFSPKIEQQIQVFQQQVERYIAQVADVDKPGRDAGVVQRTVNGKTINVATDIQCWARVVLKRADLMVAWTRATLEQQDQGGNTPVMRIVRVLGEPDRTTQFYGENKQKPFNCYQDRLESQTLVGTYVEDTTFVSDGYGHPGNYRIVQARKPYIQFPLHFDKSPGTVEHDGAIKGANSLVINKYILTLDSFWGSVSLRTSGPDPDRYDYRGDSSNFLLDVDELTQVTPDGSTADSGYTGPAMYYGHATIVLKTSAARRGVWSHAGPGDVSGSSLKSLTTRGQWVDTFPQTAQLYLYADPKTGENKGGCDEWGNCNYDYYVKGDGYFYTQNIVSYVFEGWWCEKPNNQNFEENCGDAKTLAQTYQIHSVLSGTISHNVVHNAQHGSYSLELWFWQSPDVWLSSNTTNNGDIQLGITSATASGWQSGQQVQFFIEPRIKVHWNDSRESGAYNNNAFEGTMKFDLSGLLLQVH